MPRRKLSDAFLQRVKKPGRGQVDYFDASFPGFAIRVSATGARAWTLHTRIDGKQVRLSLGRYPALSLRAARQKAGAALELIEAGKGSPRRSGARAADGSQPAGGHSAGRRRALPG